MSKVIEIITGIGMLIMIYLFLSNATSTVSIIKQLGSTSVSMVKTLQGNNKS